MHETLSLWNCIYLTLSLRLSSLTWPSYCSLAETFLKSIGTLPKSEKHSDIFKTEDGFPPMSFSSRIVLCRGHTSLFSWVSWLHCSIYSADFREFIAQQTVISKMFYSIIQRRRNLKRKPKTNLNQGHCGKVLIHSAIPKFSSWRSNSVIIFRPFKNTKVHSFEMRVNVILLG